MKMLSLTAAALLAVSTPQVQNPPLTSDKTAQVDKIFSWVAPDGPGCVAAASDHQKLVVNRAYGLADLERNVPLTSGSVFDAGSIRKQFVAAAVLILVDEGRLSLSDDVRKFIPGLPDYGHTITVDHLLTHTSGIRDWVPLLNFATGEPDAMSMILRQRELSFAPGTDWAYSNSGYVLLPEIVARVSGAPFAEFLQTRVLGPAGMTASRYVDDPAFVIPNRALAYEKRGGRWKMDMLLDDDRGGAGALFTTAADLVAWTDALAAKRFGAFVSEKIQEPATLTNGRRLDYARGLMLTTNHAGPLVWHGGSAAAYKSVVGRFPIQEISIAIVCNAGEAADARTRYAGQIFDLLASPSGTRPSEPETPAAAEGAEGVDVAGRAGLFFSERDDRPLRLVARNGRLGIAGGPALVTMSEARFRSARPDMAFMARAEFDLTFVSESEFELKTTEGETIRYRRARPYAPTADDLQMFAGKYVSDELRASFDVTAGDKGLSFRLNDAAGAGYALAPVEPDTFQFGPLTVRFHRDSAGKVVRFDFTSPALRAVKFMRQ